MDCAPHRTPAEARCWGDARNWTLGCLYRCPQDPRVWVPKHGAEHRERLAQVIAGSAVRGILCGHVHFSTVGLFAGAVCATAPAVISLLDPNVQDGVRHTDGGGFNLVQLRDGELIIDPIVLAGEQCELRYDRR